MNRTLSFDSSSSEFDNFYVERSTEADSRARNIAAVALNSTEQSGAHEREVITTSSVASPEPQIVTIETDSKKPTKT